MWSYYGSKRSIIHLYPPPKYDKIIEPFVGAGAYSLMYFDRDITIVDKYDVVINIWKWLQKCSVNDIDKLPHKLTRKDNLDNINFDCIEAKHLMGFIIAKACQSPRKTPSSRVIIDRPNTINYQLSFIKKSLYKIKHWNIVSGTYDDMNNAEATWFIDPPYQNGGYVYVENKINYEDLAKWSMSRNGQVIVCENTKADWMNFNEMLTMNGSKHKTTEAIWSNHITNYEYQQQSLF